jgi:hypothetical protein
MRQIGKPTMDMITCGIDIQRERSNIHHINQMTQKERVRAFSIKHMPVLKMLKEHRIARPSFKIRA